MDERYDVDEIEFWFENEGSWTAKEPRIRIANLVKLHSRQIPADGSS